MVLGSRESAHLSKRVFFDKIGSVLPQGHCQKAVVGDSRKDFFMDVELELDK